MRRKLPPKYRMTYCRHSKIKRPSMSSPKRNVKQKQKADKKSGRRSVPIQRTCIARSSPHKVPLSNGLLIMPPPQVPDLDTQPGIFMVHVWMGNPLRLVMSSHEFTMWVGPSRVDRRERLSSGEGWMSQGLMSSQQRGDRSIRRMSARNGCRRW